MMAQRKDMMRIIRQDAGFSAKLGFGGKGASELADRSITVPATSVEALAEPKPPSSATAAVAPPSGNTGEVGVKSAFEAGEVLAEASS